MRRYRRNSVENWGWPPLFFNEKPLFAPISHKKTPVKFFDTDAEKGVPYQKTRLSQKKNIRRCNVFYFKMEAPVHRNLLLEKSVKKVEKSSFIQEIDIRFHHLQLYLWEWKFFDNYIYFFSSFDYYFWSFQMYWVFSMLFHTWIWLFEFPIVVIFVLSQFCLPDIGVLWNLSVSQFRWRERKEDGSRSWFWA